MHDYPEMPEFAVEFFAKFARLEYALKEAGFVTTDRWRSALPDWSGFRDSPEVQALGCHLAGSPGGAYLIADPPKNQTVKDGALQFTPSGPLKDIGGLIRAVKRVRNNLFHGGKRFPGSERDERLIRSATEVIDALIEANPVVTACYYDFMR